MKFSGTYGLNVDGKQEWFDPIVDRDTELFLDPFLIFKTSNPFFQEGYETLIKFFEEAFKLGADAAVAGGAVYRRLRGMLEFPEVRELCLGYDEDNTSGSGMRRGFAGKIAGAVMESLEMGVADPRHFESLGLFHMGIAEDRISDMTANILKPQFVNYTQAVCKEYGVPLERFQTRVFDWRHLRWDSEMVELPQNKVRGGGVILTPVGFLRVLPTINWMLFRDYLWNIPGIRDDLGAEVKSALTKRGIVEYARKRRDIVREFVEWAEGRVGRPYDIVRDPKGRYQWEESGLRFAEEHPVRLNARPSNDLEFLESVAKIVEQYKRFVELSGGHELLWANGRPMRERTAQLLFLAVAKGYCAYYGIDVSREVDLGRGVVDFKFSNGYVQRLLLEVKLLSNGRFWKGLRKQLPLYMKSEGTQYGFLLAVGHTAKELEKANGLRKEALAVSGEEGSRVDVVVVDASLPKPSASRL